MPDDSYEEWATGCLKVVVEELGTEQLYAQLDKAATDDLHALYVHAEALAMHARREWLHRTTKPAGARPAGSHTCPRRRETPGVTADGGNLDRWEKGHGLTGQDEVGPSCSFCGSLAPDRFMQLIGEGWWVDPTDKAYKAYLSRPLTADQIAKEHAQWMSSPFVARIRQASCTDHAGNVEAAIEREWQQMSAARGHGQQVAKFYFQHLNDAQMDEFIQLFNDKKLRIGAPGYFYVRPYFTQPAARAEEGG